MSNRLRRLRLKKIFGLLASAVFLFAVFCACGASNAGTSQSGTPGTPGSCQLTTMKADLTIFVPEKDTENLTLSLSDAGNYGGAGAYHGQIGFTDWGQTDQLWWGQGEGIEQLGFEYRVADPIFELIVPPPPNAAYIGEYWDNNRITKTIKSFGSRVHLELGNPTC